MFELLAQQSPPPVVVPESSLFEVLLIWLILSAFWLVPLAFMLWMVISCLRKDPDRYLWIWIIVFVPFGPAVYFFLR